jgi:hypothetical protein
MDSVSEAAPVARVAELSAAELCKLFGRIADKVSALAL